MSTTMVYAPAPVSTRPTTIAGWAGVAGPILFSVAFLAQDAFRPGGHDPVADPVSALAAGPTWWVQQLNFVVFGVLTLVFAAGLHAGVRQTRGGIAGPGMVFFPTSAIGLIVLSRRLRADPAWRGIAAYTLAAGVVALAGVLVTASLILPDGAPLHDWAGLAQRVLTLAVVFPCRIALGARLVRVGRTPA